MAHAFTAALSFACVLVPFLALAEDHAGHALHHEGFYMGLKQPGTGMSCCNNRDCRPAEHRVTPKGVEFLVAGRWIMPPQSQLIEIETPDAKGHWCGNRENTATPVTYCAIVPRGGV